MEFIPIIGPIISSWIGAHFGHKGKKIDVEVRKAEMELERDKMDHDLDKYKAETERGDMQAGHAKSLQQIKSEEAENVAYESTKQESYRQASVVTGNKWLDTVRGMVRPLCLGAAMWMLFRLSKQILTPESFDNLTDEQMFELMFIFLYVVLNIICTIVNWWFAGRSSRVNIDDFRVFQGLRI